MYDVRATMFWFIFDVRGPPCAIYGTFMAKQSQKKGNRDGWVYLAWARACRKEVQNLNPCVIYGTFVAREPKNIMNRDGWVYF